MPIYLDHNATTPMCKAAKKAVWEAMERIGNASSDHCLGKVAKKHLDEERDKMKTLLNVPARGELIFTSGSTESNNMVLQGVARSLPRTTFISTQVEHPSISNTLNMVADTYGINVQYVRVDRTGRVDLNHLYHLLQYHGRVTLVTIIHTNHELGTVQDMDAIVALCHKAGTLVHTDLTQSVGKRQIDLARMEVDAASFSAHKFYGPTGVGGLYLTFKPKQLSHGGNQENQFRPGTENVPGIAGMRAALEHSLSMLTKEHAKYETLREYFLTRLTEEKIPYQVNGHPTFRSPSTISIGLPGVDSKALVTHLSMKEKICVSRGSACKAASKSGSNVLKAIGLPDDVGVLRIGMGHSTTEKHMQQLVQGIKRLLVLR